MPDYYVPSTKKELVSLIRKHYWVSGQTCSGLDAKPKKQLYAIFHSIRKQKEENHAQHGIS